MTVEPLPPEYQFGKVVGRVIHSIADTDEDIDNLPQARPAAGTVTFTPRETLRVVTAAGHQAFVTQGPEKANLSSSGRILDAEGRNGIWLVAGTWDVTFNLTAQPGITAPKIPAMTIVVGPEFTEEAPFDLTSAVSYVPPPNTTVRTLVVPAGGADGQVLTKSGEDLAWADDTGGVTDHGALAGLADDDHPQYALSDGTRGAFATVAQGALADSSVQPADLSAVATSGDYGDLLNPPTIPTTAADVGAATEAQGVLADSAVQPADLATVATTGAYGDLTGKPSIPTAPGDIGAATAAQGAKADSAVQPGDLPAPYTDEQARDAAAAALVAGTHTGISVTPDDAGNAINLTAIGTTSPDATTTSKGIVRLAGDLGGTADAPTVPGLASKADASSVPTTPVDIGAATAAQGTLADSAVQPADLHAVATTGDYSDLDNPPAIPAPSDGMPVSLGTATPGTGTAYARYDHKHPMPSATDVGAVPTTRTVAGKALSANITLAASDVGAVPTTRTVAGKALSANVTLAPTDVGAAPASHTHAQSDVTGLGTALGLKADDNAVVKLAGAQTVAGVKTFSSAPIVPDSSFAVAKTNGLQTTLDGKVTATSTITKLHGPITQAAYDALTPAADTLYVIVG